MAHNTSYRQTSILLDGMSHRSGAAAGAGSEVVDTRKYKGVANVVLAHGPFYYTLAGDADTGDTGTWTPKIEQADDTAFAVNKSDVTALTAITLDSTDTFGSPGVQTKAIDLQGVRRYIRLHWTGSADCEHINLPVAATLNVIESY